MLKLIKLLFQLVMFLQLSSAVVVIASEEDANDEKMAKPNCSATCGKVIIPYPFGMDRGECFLDDWYEVVCQNDVPRLKKTGLELFNIRGDPGYPSTALINVSFPITYASQECVAVNNNFTAEMLVGGPFFFSKSANLFVAVGCNMMTVMNTSESAVLGCHSNCWENRQKDSSSFCTGTHGCCVSKLNTYFQDFHVQFRRMKDDGAGETTTADPACSHASAFVVDQNWLEFNNITNLMSSSSRKQQHHVPVLLHWGILSTTNIGIYRNDPKYGHDDSYSCRDTGVGSLISCSCFDGFEGNPYLHQCKDINECKNPQLNDCFPRQCINIRGYYHCVDPRRTLKLVFIAIGGGIGAILLVVLGRWLYKVIKTRKEMQLKKKFFKRNGGLLLQQQLASPKVGLENNKLFTSTTLERATNYFDDNRLLGKGGQGSVYKGMLMDGRIVAVKKPIVSAIGEGNVEQFINEIFLLSQMNHRNVVKLLGCCLETEFPLLVYEFIPNGTLHHYLHESGDVLQRTWDIRLRIAAEVAGALAYLHSAASTPIYHRDIKTANILLDLKYRAKVADFGISRPISPEQTHVTTLVQGTFGYFDPEFFQSGQFTDKSDVYSFGVVLVELLTRQKPVSSARVNEGVGLATHFVISMEENCLFDIIDSEVVSPENREEIMAVADLARRCLNFSGRNRPAMKEVAMELYGIRKSQQQQKNEESGEILVSQQGDRSSNLDDEVISVLNS